MQIKLWKKPKNPIIIEGFPGFGLVGTIASEFLIDHLKTELIGKIVFEEAPPVVAIHQNKVVEPLGIFYNKKYNLVILHAITASAGSEWKLADTLVDLSKQLNAKEIISMEGVGSSGLKAASNSFYYTNIEGRKKVLDNIGLKPLKEGIIMGVTGALMLKIDGRPICCLFADTASNLPDSKAAAKIIEALDKYLGLKVDPKPLMQQAAQFEDKLKGILSSSKKAQEISDKKKLSYVG
ncbi:PAC2 family protein, partial [Candidatus Woesearchaeota archaeon]|nr:PAC2 family protein [Candidatus Woesearchaeota archaeon]